jgi:hypothetical protein
VENRLWKVDLLALGVACSSHAPLTHNEVHFLLSIFYFSLYSRFPFLPPRLSQRPAITLRRRLRQRFAAPCANSIAGVCATASRPPALRHRGGLRRRIAASRATEALKARRNRGTASGRRFHRVPVSFCPGLAGFGGNRVIMTRLHGREPRGGERRNTAAHASNGGRESRGALTSGNRKSCGASSCQNVPFPHNAEKQSRKTSAFGTEIAYISETAGRPDAGLGLRP